MVYVLNIMGLLFSQVSDFGVNNFVFRMYRTDVVTMLISNMYLEDQNHTQNIKSEKRTRIMEVIISWLATNTLTRFAKGVISSLYSCGLDSGQYSQMIAL